MRKSEEVTSPNSCLARAGSHEMLFVLLSRDPCAPAAIRAWIRERIQAGINGANDPQILEAEECARVMEREGKTHRAKESRK